MRKVVPLLIIAIILCTEHVSAQRDTIMAYMKNFVVAPWLPSSAKITGSKDSADFIRMVTTPDSNADNHLFPVYDYYLNGKPRLQCSSNKGLIEAELQGTCIEFFPNGKRKRICNYDKGQLTGEVTEYFPNGKLYLSGIYKRDTLLIYSCNDSTGKVLAENGNGTWLVYSEDCKQVIGRGFVKNGFKDGEWSGTLADTLSYNANYKNGDVITGTSISKSGKKYPFIKEYAAPEFIGGTNKFGSYLARNIRYPANAYQNNIQGRVIVTFTVNKDGALQNVRPVTGNGILKEEALRVIQVCPKWHPGTSYGVPVQVMYAIPVNFTIGR